MILIQKYIENVHFVIINYRILPIVSILQSAKEIGNVCTQARKQLTGTYVYPINPLAI